MAVRLPPPLRVNPPGWPAAARGRPFIQYNYQIHDVIANAYLLNLRQLIFTENRSIFRLQDIGDCSQFLNTRTQILMASKLFYESRKLVLVGRNINS